MGNQGSAGLLRAMGKAFIAFVEFIGSVEFDGSAKLQEAVLGPWSVVLEPQTGIGRPKRLRNVPSLLTRQSTITRML